MIVIRLSNVLIEVAVMPFSGFTKIATAWILPMQASVRAILRVSSVFYRGAFRTSKHYAKIHETCHKSVTRNALQLQWCQVFDSIRLGKVSFSDAVAMWRSFKLRLTSR